MLKRVLTTLIGLPILMLFVYLGGLWLALPLLALACLCMHEFYDALSVPALLRGVGFLFALLFYGALLFFDTRAGLMVLPIYVMALQFMWVLLYPKSELKDFFAGLTGFFYAALLLVFIFLTRQNSLMFTWLIFIAACGSDTSAYLVGRKIGRHKLESSPSPNKSIEGCVSGILGAALLAIVYALIFGDYFGGMAMFVPIVAALAAGISQLGDLFASAVKRSAGIKDYGGLLPGHGGALDRFDSIMTAAPVIFIFSEIVRHL